MTRRPVDPYRYGEIRKGPLRDFIPNLLQVWRDKTPLSGWEFATYGYGLNVAYLLCLVPFLGMLTSVLALGTFYSLCRRRHSTGEVRTWAYRLYLASVTSLALALQVCALLVLFQIPFWPVIIWAFVSLLLSQFSGEYMRYSDGPFGLTDGREWREPGTLQFLIDQFKINPPVESDAMETRRPVAKPAEKTDT